MARTVLTALGTVFGLQAVRAFFPLLVYVMRDRWGLSTVALGEITVAVFATASFLPALASRLGARRALPATALALTAARGVLQLASHAPVAALALAATSVVAFLALLAAVSRDPHVSPARGVLVGGFLDAVIHAGAGTRDLHWGGAFSDVGTWILVAVTAFAALHELRRESDTTPSEAVSPGLGFLAWGPFLFLHLEQFGNVARLSARTGLPTGTSGAIVAAGLAGGFLLARHLPRTGFWAGAPALLLAATFFGRGLVWAGAGGPLAVPTLLVTQLAGAALLARAVDGRGRARGGRDAGAFGGGFLLFLAFLFSHYAGYDLSIPVGRTALLVAAGATLLIASIGAASDGRDPAPRFSWASTALLAGLALLPLTRPIVAPALQPGGGPRPGERPERAAVGEPIRVVSFNLHNGFDETGRFAFDDMLLALRRRDPDVVAMQEVSRGWVINGCADLFELAREALGLVGVPGPSVVPDWGNAVFTRWSPRASRIVALPPSDLPLPRSALLVDLDDPGDGSRPFRILATHFHHVTDGDAVREEQARFLARGPAAPSDPTPSLLLGDFNAEPESRCLGILAAAGWRDVFGVDDPGAEIDRAARTNPSAVPRRRIDTIFFRGPWRLLRAEAAPPWGSDHRAVIAELLLEGRLEVSGSGNGS